MTTHYPGIRPRGNSIVMDFTYMGVRCRESIRVKPTKTALKEISRKRETILYEIDMGSFDYGKHFPTSKNALKFGKNKGALITVEEQLKQWIRKAEKRCQHSTIRDYNSAIFYHLIPNFGHLTLDQFSIAHVYEWLDTINISNKRINNVLGPLRQALQDAFFDGIIEQNPMDRFRYLSPDTSEPEPFKPAEIDKILAQLDGQCRNLIQFAFWSGLRTSELIALRWQDVDMANQKAHIRTAIVRKREKTTKTTSGQRTIELMPNAHEALLSQQQLNPGSNRVFLDPTTGKQWDGDHIVRKRVWIPALNKARVKYRNPYQTRHTYASMLLSQGKNPMWVAQQMGHKDWGMIRKVYGRWIAAD
jgi:integrase